MNEIFRVDGISFNLPGFVLIPDLAPLLGHSAQRGGDPIVPGIPGGDAHAREIDITVVNLNGHIYGRLDHTGAAHPDVRTGMYRNLKFLQTLTTPPATVAGTRTATLQWQSEPIVTKPVHMLGELQTADDNTTRMKAVFRFSFPEGLFEL